VSEDRLHTTKALEAIIFAADEPCDEARLATVLEVSLEELEGLIAELHRLLESSALHLVRLAGGYHLATRPQFADYVQRLREPEPEKLSRQAMETLAIVAYRQPITRPEIDEIRGVNSSGAVNSLLGKGLVAISGRKTAPGRPFMFSSTPHFLSAFGLNDLDELPQLSEPDAELLQALAAKVAAGELGEDDEATDEAHGDEDETDDEAADDSPLQNEEHDSATQEQ